MIAPVGGEAVELLAALHQSAFDMAWSANAIAAMLANPNTFALLSSQETPSGFAMAWVVASEAELLTLAVMPSARRGGVAAALVRAVIERVRARGAQKLHLEVAADNAPALALYDKLGFQPSGRRVGYYARGADEHADALLLSLALD